MDVSAPFETSGKIYLSDASAGRYVALNQGDEVQLVIRLILGSGTTNSSLRINATDDQDICWVLRDD